MCGRCSGRRSGWRVVGGLDADLLCGAHGLLLESVRGADKEPGAFRSRLNWINGRHPSAAEFVPPPPQEVGRCMRDLLRFVNADDGTPDLIRAGMAHAQFETIHPFLDGNGRLGRLLISLMLHRLGALRAPLLYLSLYLKQRRTTYYYLLNEMRMAGDWEAWLAFFINGVRETAAAAVDLARRLAALVAGDRVRIQAEVRRSASAQLVHRALSERPIHSIAGLAKMSGISWPAAAAAVERLSRLGIAREITGRSRKRLYAYDAYIELLNEGMEPL